MKHFFLFLLFPFASLAASQCSSDKLASYTLGTEIIDNLVHVDADKAKMTPEWGHLQGNVVAKRGQEVFYTDKLDYQRQKQQILSESELTYGRPGLAVRSQSTDYSLLNNEGVFKEVEYYIGNQNANGQADRLQVNRDKQIEDLTEATYTTCSRTNPAWFLKAGDLHLDHKLDIGIAKNVTFRVADIPVMYLPYFSFPLSDSRKTGFLTPKVGSSSSRGFELTTPFYINIAPNHDATLYPQLMSERGVMLGGEYRYLLTHLNGYAKGAYLKDRKAKDTRWAFKTEHTYTPTNNLTISTLYQKVSDKSYVKDLVDNVDLSDDKFLPSYLKASYRLSPNYNINAEAKTYQVVDKDYTEKNKPYEVLPRVRGKGRWTLGNNFFLSSDTEFVNFDKKNQVAGVRFDEKLQLSYNFKNSYSFIKPSASYRFSSYHLRDQGKNKPSKIQRSVPTFTVDTGLYFDRQGSWLGKNVTQSLEPRLFYLYTPYEKQSDIPNFDSAVVSSSYSAMFLDNRFNGKDRIGDANQLTTAISTNFTDNDTGKELASFSVGQIQYFQDRKVAFNGKVADSSRSNVIAEARASVTDDVKVRGLLHYDTDDRETEKSIIGVTYNPEADKSVNFSHLYDKDDYEQLDVSGVWKLNDTWRVFGRWHYSVEYEKTLDALAGVEYAKCCWAARLVGRQKRKSATSKEEPENSIYFEFVLNGLGKLGNSAGSVLQNVIPNYQPLSYE